MTESIHGTNWSLSNGVINFFRVNGKMLSDKSWAIANVGDRIWVQVSPQSIMPEIRQCIERDVAAGLADRIAQVQLGARQAVVFFLEGKLKVQHLRKATEPDTSNFIDIPSVAVDDRTLTVRILAQPTFAVATADSKGNVI